CARGRYYGGDFDFW
nr:immunoglobulin heavy chain junction region [Macaca mulatta]